MASTIAAITTSGGGVITTADSSGNLSLLSGATTVVAVTSTGVAVTGTLSSSGASTLTGAITATAGINTPNTFGFKNRIINGGMVIDQRNAGASVTVVGNSYVSVDRWQTLCAVGSKYSIQQNAGSVTPPIGFSKYLGVTSLANTSLGATDYYYLQQNIEGFNTADLGWGTANAKTVTLSFQVYSSLTGTFGGAIQNSAGNRSYPFSYSIPVANTWTTISVTIAGDTTGTWIGATNGIGLGLLFSLGTGTTYSGTAGAWVGTGLASTTGATSVVGTSGATLYITGVQLEKGSTATSFDFRAYSTEFAMCQRYYARLQDTLALSGSLGTLSVEATSQAYGTAPFSMRATPSSTFSGLTISDGNVIPAVTSVSNLGSIIGGVAFTLNCSAATLTVGRAARIRNGSGTAYLDFSAEL
jgi:hypothetical protein